MNHKEAVRGEPSGLNRERHGAAPSGFNRRARACRFYKRHGASSGLNRRANLRPAAFISGPRLAVRFESGGGARALPLQSGTALVRFEAAGVPPSRFCGFLLPPLIFRSSVCRICRSVSSARPATVSPPVPGRYDCPSPCSTGSATGSVTPLSNSQTTSRQTSGKVFCSSRTSVSRKTAGEAAAVRGRGQLDPGPRFHARLDLDARVLPRPQRIALADLRGARPC